MLVTNCQSEFSSLKKKPENKAFRPLLPGSHELARLLLADNALLGELSFLKAIVSCGDDGL